MNHVSLNLLSSLSPAEEDAGDAEQDAATDARQRAVMSPGAELCCAAAPPAVSLPNDSETSRL